MDYNLQDCQRQRVVEIAREWVGTPYHTGARIKGAGADCLTLLAEVYAEAGIIERVAAGIFSVLIVGDHFFYIYTRKCFRGLIYSGNSQARNYP